MKLQLNVREANIARTDRISRLTDKAATFHTDQHGRALVFVLADCRHNHLRVRHLTAVALAAGPTVRRILPLLWAMLV